jgi:hypothetical protein
MQQQLLLDTISTMNLKLKKRLIKEQKYIDTKISSDNTLYILDWDDTLFPTSWVTKNGIDIINNNSRDRYIEHFKSLDRTLNSFLRNISKHGKVIIVTNALKDWVKLSSIVIPQTYHVLKNINIVSARSLFSDKTKNIMEWKKSAFQLVIDEEFKNKRLMNIISIGDAEYEHQALVSLTHTNFDKIKFLKSFRLIKDPTYDQLIEEVELLDTCIHKFWKLKEQICKTIKLHDEVK